MKTTRINLVLEWARAPAAFRLEFDHARVVAGGINVGWGTQDKSTQRFTFTSTDDMCRVCFGLDAEGAEKDGIQAVVRVVETEKPFCVNVADLLQAEGNQVELKEPHARIYAEVDWFAML